MGSQIVRARASLCRYVCAGMYVCAQVQVRVRKCRRVSACVCAKKLVHQTGETIEMSVPQNGGKPRLNPPFSWDFLEEVKEKSWPASELEVLHQFECCLFILL